MSPPYPQSTPCLLCPTYRPVPTHTDHLPTFYSNGRHTPFLSTAKSCPRKDPSKGAGVGLLWSPGATRPAPDLPLPLRTTQRSAVSCNPLRKPVGVKKDPRCQKAAQEGAMRLIHNRSIASISQNKVLRMIVGFPFSPLLLRDCLIQPFTFSVLLKTDQVPCSFTNRT